MDSFSPLTRGNVNFHIIYCAGGRKALDRALSLLSPYHRLVIRWLLHSHTNIDRESGEGYTAKQSGFFLKISKEIGKARRKSLACAKGASLTPFV